MGQDASSVRQRDQGRRGDFTVHLASRVSLLFPDIIAGSYADSGVGDIVVVKNGPTLPDGLMGPTTLSSRSPTLREARRSCCSMFTSEPVLNTVIVIQILIVFVRA